MSDYRKPFEPDLEGRIAELEAYAKKLETALGITRQVEKVSCGGGVASEKASIDPRLSPEQDGAACPGGLGSSGMEAPPAAECECGAETSRGCSITGCPLYLRETTAQVPTSFTVRDDGMIEVFRPCILQIDFGNKRAREFYPNGKESTQEQQVTAGVEVQPQAGTASPSTVTPGPPYSCELCGHPMPPGEEMFKFHVYSGPCKFSQTKDASCCTKDPCCMDPATTSNEGEVK